MMKYLIFFGVYTMLNAVSIFELPGDDLTLEVPREAKLCGIRYVSPTSSTHKTISECVEIGLNLEDTINLLKQKSKNRKELIVAFFLESSLIRPGLRTIGKEWKLSGIVYNYKENLYRLEVYDADDKYFYFEKEVQNIKLVLNKK